VGDLVVSLAALLGFDGTEEGHITPLNYKIINLSFYVVIIYLSFSSLSLYHSAVAASLGKTLFCLSFFALYNHKK
jgi:hypothetical protein